MVPGVLSRQRLVLGALALAAMVVVALVAAEEPNGGAASVALAVALAPVAVAATAALAARVAGDRFAVGAAASYVVLPLLANRFMLHTYQRAFDARALPALVGTQHTAVFAIGVAGAVTAAIAPKAAAAAGGAAAVVVTAAAWQFAGLGGIPPGLHETVWSVSLTEWLFAAGVLGVLLRAPLLGLAVGGWLCAAVLWGAHRGYGDAGLWRSLAIAAPAVAVAFTSLALLAPRLHSARRRGAAPSER